MNWMLLFSLVALAGDCSQSQPSTLAAVAHQSEASTPCQVESDRDSYMRGQPILLRVWCSRSPFDTRDRQIVDDLLMGKGQIVVTLGDSEAQGIHTGPIAAPHIRPDKLGFSYSFQTYDFGRGTQRVELGLRLELDYWSSNEVRVSVTGPSLH